MSATRKIEEARFFLELFDALMRRGSSLTNGENRTSEASFLFGAILNAFYSGVALLQESKLPASAFKKAHPVIYDRGSEGGLRGKHVHISPVEMSAAGYVPPSGDSVALQSYTWPEPKLTKTMPSEGGRVVLTGETRYYFTHPESGRSEDVFHFCMQHYFKWSKHIEEAVAAQQVAAADV